MQDTDIHLFPMGYDLPSLCTKHRTRETVAQPGPGRRLCAVCAFLSINLIGHTTTALETGIGPTATIIDALREWADLNYEIPAEALKQLTLERKDWWDFLPRHVLPPVDVLADLIKDGGKV